MKSLLNKIVLLLCLSVAFPIFAHDGGHGPATKGVGKYGGILASVIDKADMKKHHHDVQPVYQAELVKLSDQTVRVYFYDKKEIKKVSLEKFPQTIEAVVETKDGDKFVNQKFQIQKDKKYFSGKYPKPQKMPFNIELNFIEGGKTLFVAFENLD